MDKQNLQEHWNLLMSAQKLCLAQNLMAPEEFSQLESNPAKLRSATLTKAELFLEQNPEDKTLSPEENKALLKDLEQTRSQLRK